MIQWPASRRELPLLLVTVALIVPASASSKDAAPYPLDLTTAIAHAYGNDLASIKRTCQVFVSLRDLEALAVVNLRGGRADVAAFQFINTAGWFNTWRRHSVAPGVDAAMRPTVPTTVRKLAAACSTKWRP